MVETSMKKMPVSKLIWLVSPFALLLCQALLPGAEMFYTNRLLVLQGVEVYSITESHGFQSL